jgi:mannan endo-1,4-beta-mannosidase
MFTKSWRYLSVFIIFFFSLLQFFSFATTAHAVEDTDSFVTRNGTKFYLNGNEFRFVGFNLFDAAATSTYKCAWWPRLTDQELDDALKYMREQSGTTVLRFWAFQKYTDSGQDWSGIDKVIRLAKKNGIKVIPVIENGPSHCTGDTTKSKWQYQNDTWYVSGYKTTFGTDKLSYRDYVKAIVTRYKDDPTVFGWMMMNEADTSKRDANGKSVLVNFAKDIGALIKSIDSKHLVTVGTQSNGASGASGKDFVDVYGVAEVDFTEAHDWGFWSGNEADPLPGSANGSTLPDVNSADCVKTYQAKVACSIANSVQVLNKPFVMGEGGAKAEDNATARQTRANIIDGKIKASFDNGVAGYLVWQWNTIIDSEKYDVLQKHNDPIMGKMKVRSGYLPKLPGIVTSPTPSPVPTPSPTPKPSVSPSPSASPNPTASPNSCGRADINRDGKVDIFDYAILVANFMKSTFVPEADINQDGKVDIFDYSLLAQKFLKKC